MIITITTDFGYKDPYVAMMKGVLLKSLGPSITVVDISHDVGNFSIKRASFIIHHSYKFFPKGSFHLVVVDPGVGSKRGIISLRTKDGHTFVAPNNGVLSPFFWEENVEAISVFNPNTLPYPTTGRTFQGRDLFSPLLADLATGRVKIEGHLYEKPIVSEKPKKLKTKSGIEFEVLYVDGFGNAVTNLERNDVAGKKFRVMINGKTISKIFPSFSEGKENEVFFIEGGFGLLEIAMKEKSAADHLSIKEGDRFKLVWLS